MEQNHSRVPSLCELCLLIWSRNEEWSNVLSLLPSLPPKTLVSFLPTCSCLELRDIELACLEKEWILEMTLPLWKKHDIDGRKGYWRKAISSFITTSKKNHTLDNHTLEMKRLIIRTYTLITHIKITRTFPPLDLLLSLHHIIQLDLYHIKCYSEWKKNVPYLVKTMISLKTLGIYFTNLSLEMITSLWKEWSHRKIKQEWTLKLVGCTVSEEASLALLAFVPTVATLVIENCSLYDKTTWLDTIRQARELKSVTLVDLDLDAEDWSRAVVFGETLGPPVTLTTTVPTTPSPHALTTLDLSHNTEMGGSGILSLCCALATFGISQLQSLTLRGIPLGKLGCTALVDTLNKNQLCQLTILIVDDCHIPPYDMSCLIYALSTNNSSLHTLDISSNFLGKEVADEIVSQVITSFYATLHALFITRIGLENTFLIVQALSNHSCPSLRTFHLGENRMGDTSLLQLIDTCRIQCLALEELDLHGTSLTNKGLISICSMLIGKRKWKEFDFENEIDENEIDVWPKAVLNINDNQLNSKITTNITQLRRRIPTVFANYTL